MNWNIYEIDDELFVCGPDSRLYRPAPIDGFRIGQTLLHTETGRTCQVKIDGRTNKVRPFPEDDGFDPDPKSYLELTHAWKEIEKMGIEEL